MGHKVNPTPKNIIFYVSDMTAWSRVRRILRILCRYWRCCLPLMRLGLPGNYRQNHAPFRISKRVGVPEAELDERLTAMAHRGLVLDFNIRGKRYFMLPSGGYWLFRICVYAHP